MLARFSVIAMLIFMAITELRRKESSSLFLLIFSNFLTFNQCFLYCNMALVNLWKSDEVSSETLYPCFYCFTVGECLKACGPQFSLMSLFLLSFLY